MAQDQDQTIAFLMRAQSYGSTGNVERIDTHCALVFLIGDRAFKLKRAVKFPYLDYSSPALRKRACQAELRLNRRTAPGIYLEVRPINRLASGQLTFEAGGTPVDWVVVMQRFDQGDLFDMLAARNQLTHDMLRRLTDKVVEFHASAERTTEHGGSSAMRAVIAGNQENMALGHAVISQDLAKRLTHMSLAALDKVSPVLDARQISGEVRRCHGDLHLGNICLFKGEPTLFDCIEFSDDIACTDVYYDLAFLVMDLWQRNLKAEANQVFNRYIDMTSDTPGVVAMPLFLSIRAALRAHVCAAASTNQPSVAKRLQKQADAQHYLLEGIELLQPRNPCLIAIGGLSGTGKSTLAQALACDLGLPPGARVLRSDVVRKRIRDVSPETHLSKDAYTIAQMARVYQDLAARAACNVASGYAVVIDAVFAKAEERLAIEEVARKAGIPFFGLWLTAPTSVLEERLQKRQMDASDATIEVLHRQLDYAVGALGNWQAIDAGGDFMHTLELARSAIGKAI